MNLSADRHKVYCHICAKWLNLEQETLVIDYGSNDPKDDPVDCMFCLGTLGYRKDVPHWNEHKEE